MRESSADRTTAASADYNRGGQFLHGLKSGRAAGNVVAMQQRTTVGRAGSTWRDSVSIRHATATVAADLADLFRARYVVGLLVVNQLKVRYQRSSLGFLWTLINPLLMLSVLSLFVGQVMRVQVPHYPVYLFSGLIPWQFFAASVTNGSMSLIHREALIRKVRVPKSIFPLAETLVAAVNMLFAMVALFIMLQLFHPGVYAQLVLVPVGLVLLGAFTLGMTVTAMTLVTYFRDLEHIIAVLLQVFYFACPIFYRSQDIGRYQWVLKFNPMTHFLRIFQCAFYEGVWPGWPTWAAAGGSAAISMVLAYVVYKGCEHNYIFRL